MAIPFVVDEEGEHDEALLQQLFGELCQTLREIRQVQAFRNAQAHISRPRITWSPSVIEVSTNMVDFEHRYPDFGINVALSLSPGGLESDLENLASQTATTSTAENNRRRQSRSEPPCYEDTKPLKVSVTVEVTNRDWPKQEQPVNSGTEKTCTGTRSLFSKLVPAPFGGPIWTAVICVVGWHLLRAR